MQTAAAFAYLGPTTGRPMALCRWWLWSGSPVARSLLGMRTFTHAYAGLTETLGHYHALASLLLYFHERPDSPDRPMRVYVPSRYVRDYARGGERERKSAPNAHVPLLETLHAHRWPRLVFEVVPAALCQGLRYQCEHAWPSALTGTYARPVSSGLLFEAEPQPASAQAPLSQLDLPITSSDWGYRPKEGK